MESVSMIEVVKQDNIATITFNRPAALNALTRDLCEQTLAALRDAAASGARAAVITGKGRAFSAGADLLSHSHLFAQGADAIGREVGFDLQEVSNPLVEAIVGSPIPVVSAVNGLCVGGAVGIALAADIVVAARSAYFLTPQVAQLGIVPDLGATWTLPRKIGRARALGVMLLGQRMPAQLAQDWGLIWKCVDDDALVGEALSIARRLAGVPSAAVRATRSMVDAAPNTPLAAQLETERLWQIKFLASGFFRDAVERFIAASSTHAQ